MTMIRTATALSLLALLSPALAAQGDLSPRKQLRALQQELTTAVDAWRTGEMKKVQDAVKAGKPVPMMSMAPPTAEFIKRGQALAEKFAGTDDAVGFLMFVIESATVERQAMQQALAQLHKDHTTSSRIGEQLYVLQDRASMLGRDAVLSFLDAVVPANKDEETLVQAYLVRSAVRLSGAKGAADVQLARKDLIKIKSITDDEDYHAMADQLLFEVDNLQVGCKAPEIVGQDTDGVDFKLSDYRGKVVMLDFWGFW